MFSSTYLLFQHPKVFVQCCNQLEYHSTWNGGVAGSHKHLARSAGGHTQGLGVVVTGEEQPAGGHGVQHSQDVGEVDGATRGDLVEGVYLDSPASRQGVQSRGYVLCLRKDKTVVKLKGASGDGMT